MAADLEHEDLDEFFENAALSLHWVGPDGTILRANRFELDGLGYEREEYEGHHIAEFHVDGEVIEDILARLSRNETLRDYEARMRAKDGSIRHVVINSNVRWKDGEFIHTRCFTRDITDRKHLEDELARTNAQLEQKVAERTAELERSNRELEQFAFVASHDLRQPLATVLGFAQTLAKRYGGRLGDEADFFLNRLIEAADRMRRMIDDLLAFATVGVDQEADSVTDARQALDAAIANLHASVEESCATVGCVTELPAVRIGESLLVQLFQNLLANAIRFRAAERPRIEVSAQVEAGLATFRVRDNGIGVPEHDAQRMFDLFARHADERAGSGIGLAICKKIVEHHGGSIGLERPPTPGTTITFSLPAAA